MSSIGAEVATVASRALLRTLRAPQAMFAYIAQPVLLLLLFSQVFHGVVDLEFFRRAGFDSYLQFFVPAALGLAVVVAGLGSGVSIVADIESGMLDKLRVAPIRRSSIILGRMAADAVRTGLQACALLAVGFALGARFAGAPGVALAIGATVVASLVLGALSTALATKLRNAEAVTAIVNLVSLPLLFLSTALMPSETFPAWLRSVARANPVSHLINLNRDLLVLGATATQVAVAAGVLIAALLTAVTLASRGLAASS